MPKKTNDGMISSSRNASVSLVCLRMNSNIGSLSGGARGAGSQRTKKRRTSVRLDSRRTAAADGRKARAATALRRARL